MPDFEQDFDDKLWEIVTHKGWSHGEYKEKEIVKDLKALISQTVTGCIPESENEHTNNTRDKNETVGFNKCRDTFIQSLKEKGVI